MRLDVDPASGSGFLVGDAVNVAARSQAAAPAGGVAVGGLTHGLTKRVIEYEQLPPVVAKGKSDPLPAWRALAALARSGIDAYTGGLTPLHRPRDGTPSSPPTSTRRGQSSPSSPSSSVSPASARAASSASFRHSSTPDRR